MSRILEIDNEELEVYAVEDQIYLKVGKKVVSLIDYERSVDECLSSLSTMRETY
jgi:hypothetical protein